MVVYLIWYRMDHLVVLDFDTCMPELASRFLGDYLTGDKYFRIDYPEHNLVRARAQLALYKDMMVHMGDMQNIVKELAE